MFGEIMRMATGAFIFVIGACAAFDFFQMIGGNTLLSAIAELSAMVAVAGVSAFLIDTLDPTVT